MELGRMARILYNMSLDMDYADYIETAEMEIAFITRELKILKGNGCDSTLQMLEVIAGKNEGMEFWMDGKLP